MADSSISALLNATISVPTIDRTTIADGNALQSTLMYSFSARDIELADYIQSLSGNTYHHDAGTNKIFHYKDNDPLSTKVYDLLTDSITATNLTATNLTATTLSSTNVTATNVTANNNLYVLSSDDATAVTAATAIFANLTAANQTNVDYIAANSAAWIGISAISATGMTSPFTGRVFQLLPGTNVGFKVNSDQTGITVSASSNMKAYVTGTTLYIGA